METKQKTSKRVSAVLLAKNESIVNNDESSSLLQIYTLFNQAMYAVSAIPCQVCLAIAPVFLMEQKNMDIQVIGYMMSAGSVFGVIGMKVAEKMEHGFLFRRPKDLYFLIASMGIYLITIPIWPTELWYLSGAFMVLVLASGDTLMPVVAESVHRLSIMADKKPEQIFAQANMCRRFNGGLIGLLAPLIYNFVPALPFYFFGGCCLVFLAIYCAVDYKIKSVHRYSKIRVGPNKSIVVGMSMRSTQYFSSQTLSAIFGRTNSSDIDVSSRRDRSNRSNSIMETLSTPEESAYMSVIGALKNFIETSQDKCIKEEDEKEDSSSEEVESADLTSLEEGKKVDATLVKDTKSQSTKSVETTAHESELFDASEGAIENEDSNEMISSNEIIVRSVELGPEQSKDLSVALSSSLKAADRRSTILRSSTLRQSTLRSSLMRSVGLHREASGRLSSTLSSSKRVRFGDSENAEVPVVRMSDASIVSTEPQDMDLSDRYSYFLVVYALPFFDMANIVFPFSFLSIAITNGRILPFVVFAYQMGRGVSQSIQVWRLNSTITYILNGIPLLAFIAFATYTSVSDGDLWYIPLLFTSLSETMPAQQRYLMRLFQSFRNENEDNSLALRIAVKASHASTGFGSIYSFLVVSQVYSRYGIAGASYLGLGMATTKFLTILQIDMLHARKMRNVERETEAKVLNQRVTKETAPDIESAQ